MGVIVFPWPPAVLSPNNRAHRFLKARAGKMYRSQCRLLSLHVKVQGEGPIPITITFRPPDRMRRDRDNMLAAMKSGLDGLADALKVDDERFELTIKRGEPVRGGWVEIEIGGGFAEG